MTWQCPAFTFLQRHKKVCSHLKMQVLVTFSNLLIDKDLSFYNHTRQFRLCFFFQSIQAGQFTCKCEISYSCIQSFISLVAFTRSSFHSASAETEAPFPEQSKQVTRSHLACAQCLVRSIKTCASTITQRQSRRMRVKWRVSKAVYSDLICNAFRPWDFFQEFLTLSASFFIWSRCS